MLHMNVVFDEPAWPDLAEKQAKGDLIHLRNGEMKVAVLDAGLTSGRPSVAVRIDLPDGKSVLGETSARLFCTAGRMIAGKYPDLFVDQ